MIDIGSTITIATEILSLAPKVAELFNKSRNIFSILHGMKMEEDDMPPVLAKVAKNEQEILSQLIDDYYNVYKDPTADSIEKKNAQIRIAAKICQLLTGIEPLKESIPGYDTVKEMYCNSVPAALNA